MKGPVPINLLTALPAEAKPLIERFNLQRNHRQTALPVYQAGDIQLAVSGVGIPAIREATRYLKAISVPDQPVAWLNIGICGHGSHTLGEAMIAERVITPQGDRWDLSVPPGLAERCGVLCCVERPQAVYAAQMAYDMESAGFLAALNADEDMHRIGVLKVVSDNPEHGSEKITTKGVRALIAQQAALITHMIDWLTRDD
ncbi:MAG: hypothetical protein ABW101_18985 [Candidatus Thiodiazotropha sp.]